MNNQKGNIIGISLIINLILFTTIHLTTLAMKRIEKDKAKLKQNIFLKRYSNELKSYIQRINYSNKALKYLTIASYLSTVTPKVKLVLTQKIRIIKAWQAGILGKYLVFLAVNGEKFLNYQIVPHKVYHRSFKTFKRNFYNQTIIYKRSFSIKSYSPLISEITFYLRSNDSIDLKITSKRFSL